jgi:hypothetical protein
MLRLPPAQTSQSCYQIHITWPDAVILHVQPCTSGYVTNSRNNYVLNRHHQANIRIKGIQCRNMSTISYVTISLLNTTCMSNIPIAEPMYRTTVSLTNKFISLTHTTLYHRNMKFQICWRQWTWPWPSYVHILLSQSTAYLKATPFPSVY